MGKEINPIEMNKSYLMNDVIAYRIAIENLAKNSSSSLFENSGPSHAAIVMGNIFKNSNKSVKIFAGDFNGAVSDNPYYLEGLKSYLAKGKPIQIIFENNPNPESKALELIKLSTNGNISVKKLRSDATISQKKHFVIGDDKMFRLETSKKDYEALCSFNQPDFVKKLESVYSELLAQSDYCLA